MNKFLDVAKYVLLGSLGWILMASSVHLYQDHQNFHAMLNMIIQANQPKPAPESTPTPTPAESK